MAFEETDGAGCEDDVEEATVVSEVNADDELAAEEHPGMARDDEEDCADDDEDECAELVLVLFGRIGLFTLLLALALLLLLLVELLEEAGLMDADPEPAVAIKAGPLFCWPVGAAPTFGAGMFWHGGSQSADVLDGSGIRFPFLRDRRTYDRDEENEALGMIAAFSRSMKTRWKRYAQFYSFSEAGGRFPPVRAAASFVFRFFLFFVALLYLLFDRHGVLSLHSVLCWRCSTNRFSSCFLAPSRWLSLSGTRKCFFHAWPMLAVLPSAGSATTPRLTETADDSMEPSGTSMMIAQIH